MQSKGTKKSEGERIFTADGKMAGIRFGATFRKDVSASKHFLQKPPAIAIDVAVYNRVRMWIDTIEVFDRESNTTYKISRSSFEMNRRELDRAFGKQYYVPLQFWGKSTPGEVKQESLEL